MLIASIFVVLLASVSLPVPVSAVADPPCNGHVELCDRKFSNISFIGAHDSPFVGDGLQDNQNVDVVAQLNAGIRFLQGQTHEDVFGELSLCHTNCFLEDAGSLQSYLSTVKSWLDQNPNEVVALLLTNGDSKDVSTFADSFKASNLDTLTYSPPENPLPFDQWPTLQDLIKANTRLIAFLDYGADVKKATYILDEFAYFFETPFDTTDPTFAQCKIDRPPQAKPEGLMYIVNHYLDKSLSPSILVPDRDRAATTNAATGEGSIGAQGDLCQSLYQRPPNVVLVDFFDQGKVFEAQDRFNGL